jgi:hypothetical protein
MIEFEEKKGSTISPEDSEIELPSSQKVELFFENHFKKNVDEYLIFKKNQFKNPNKEIIKDFIIKFEGFVKDDNKDMAQLVDLVFNNILNNIKILEEMKCLPDNKKMLSFFVSFIISKFFH